MAVDLTVGTPARAAGAAPAAVAGRRLKVLVLVSSNRFSGPARQILQLFEHVNHDQFELLLGSEAIHGLPRPALTDEAERRGIPFTDLRQWSTFDPYLVWQVWRSKRQNGVDILQSHGYKPAVVCWIVKRLSGMKWVAFLHGETRENAKVMFYNRLQFRAVKAADRIVTVSEEMRTRSILRGGVDPRRIVAVHNAIDPRQYGCSASGEEIRRELRVLPGERLLGVIGRFSPEKGHVYFLEALRSLVTEVPNVRALLVGEGPQEAQLRAYCAEHGLNGRVIFTGYQSDMARFYPALDMVVVPSLSEGLPNVALESLLFQKPVVATRVGGTPEVIINDLTGVLVPPASSVDLAGAIAQLLPDAERRQRFAENGQQLLIREYLPYARIRKVEKLYREVAGA